MALLRLTCMRLLSFHLSQSAFKDVLHELSLLLVAVAVSLVVTIAIYAYAGLLA